MKQFDLVLIEWEDSFGVGSHWQEVSADLNPSAVSCFSVGWLVAENDRCIVVVPHMHDKDDAIGAAVSGCGDMTIPKSCVLNRTLLRPKEGP